MDQIKLFHENVRGTTVVSNLFIDRYMKDANDAQLKVYFYLLRSISDDRACSITDIADQFNHTEKDVIRSLRYWENAGLLSIDVAGDSEITGIHLLPIPEYIAPSMPYQMKPTPLMPLERPVFKTVPVPAEEIMPVIPSKPKYSTKDIKEFSQKEEGSVIVCMAENYLKTAISPDLLKSLMYIHLELDFNCDRIDELLQYCAEKKLRNYSAIEKIAVGWYEQGNTDSPMGGRELVQYDENMHSIMKALGKNSTPTAKEIEFMNKWMNTFAFSMDIILYGCERTVLATDSFRFEYADGIFTKWKEENVVTLEDVKAAEAAFRNKKPAAKKTSKNKFTCISKSNYDFANLEKDILNN